MKNICGDDNRLHCQAYMKPWHTSSPARDGREVDAMGIKEIILQKLLDNIGEGIHSGLRKATDGAEAIKAYRAIKAMPNKEWEGVLRWACEPITDYLFTALRPYLATLPTAAGADKEDGGNNA